MPTKMRTSPSRPGDRYPLAAELDGLKVFAERRDSTYFLKLGVLLSLFLLSFLAIITTTTSKPRSNTHHHHTPSPADYHHHNSFQYHHQSPPIGHFYENQLLIRPYDLPSRRDFWSDLHAALKNAQPTLHHPIKSLLQPPGFTPDLRFLPDDIDDYLIPRHLGISDEDIASLRANHSSFRDRLDQIPLPPYTRGSRGVVVTVGEGEVPALVTMLKVLRHTGSRVPVEVFMRGEVDERAGLCKEVLPLLKANCISLDKILEASPIEEEENESGAEKRGLVGHQFDVLAMLFSSFEDMLFLDVGNLALSNPDRLFNAEFFRSTGLVIWSDFWKMTYNPALFNVTSSSAPDKLRLPSLAPGQLLVSKRTHIAPLLLASYYNFYGPGMYYTLLSQAEPREGYKETFIPAILLLDKPFHFVTTSPRPWRYSKMEESPSGHNRTETKNKQKEKNKKESPWTGDGPALHADPMWDFALPRSKAQTYSWPNNTHPPGNSHLFLHARFPTLDPRSVLGKGGLAWGEGGVKPQRLWEKVDEVISAVGYDIEPIVWVALKETACELARVEWGEWKDGRLCRLFEEVGKELEEEGVLDLGVWSKRTW